MIAAQPRSIGEIFDRAVNLVVRRWSAAVVSVAANDYRVRTEGIDLEAGLDAAGAS